MDREDEILDTLKKILAAQEASLEISRDFQRRSEESRTNLAATQARVASMAKTAKFARYFGMFMAAIVLALIVYVIVKIESMPPPIVETVKPTTTHR